ncbi:helix-turn-helix transcriptional regulator [Nonomuraea sp. NPDC023979]|uniref:helix-turn-helix domain-containing protein n=1 Tax=Nonomuraea sp. NPDC023979 TaxID=3154796 RepID=UPI0033D2F325
MQIYSYSRRMGTGENRNVPERKLRQNGSALRDFRCKAGVKRSALAKQVGISYSALANIENEHRDVSVEVLNRLANALTVNLRSVLRDPPSASELDQLAYDDACERAS